MVGDGWTDAEVRLAGAADRFHAFTEIVAPRAGGRRRRASVAARSTNSCMPKAPAPLVLPARQMRILLLENVHPPPSSASSTRATVETVKGALDEDDLIEAMQGVHVLGVRSKTRVSARVLEAAPTG